jgi:hypothetical protein
MRSPNGPQFAVSELILSFPSAHSRNKPPLQGQNVPNPEHGIISDLHWPGFSRVPAAYFAICFVKYLRYRDCRIVSGEIEFGIS